MAEYIPPYCTFGHQHSPACVDRVRRADQAMHLCVQATETIRALEKNHVSRLEQMDLFAPTDTAELISFWRGVHRACGVEYRRMSRIFWKRCPHGTASAGQGDGP